MTERNARVSSSGPAPPKDLGRKTAAGMVWLTLQAVGTKVLTFGQQIVLSYLLAPESYGLFGLALTVQSLFALLSAQPLQEILIHRHMQFRRWATPIFWMGLAMSVMAGFLMAVAAPIAARAFASPDVMPLVLLMAISPVLNGLGLVPMVKLRCDLKFGLLARIGVSAAAFQVVLAVALAALGTGAYALALARLGQLGYRAAGTWYCARPPIRMRLQIRRWRLLTRDVSRSIGASAARPLSDVGDYLMLGAFHSERVVGLYFWAFSQSTQALQLILVNVNSTIAPGLSKLQVDPERQARSFVRGATMMALAGVPLCLLQSAIAEPAIRIVFNHRYYEATPILQVLSLGMAVRLATGSSLPLLTAQGKFGAMMVFSWIQAIAILGAAVLGANLGAGLSVACAVALAIAFSGSARMVYALKDYPDLKNALWRMLAVPLLAGLFAASVSLFAQKLVRPTLPSNVMARDLIAAGVGIVAMAGAYIPMVWFFTREECRDLYVRLRDLMSGPLRRIFG